MADKSQIDALIKEIQDFKASTKVALAEIHDDVKAVRTKVGELESGIKELRREVEIVRGEQDDQRLDIITMKENWEVACSRIKYLESQVEKAEQYSRRDNVMLYGIHEPSNELPASCKQTVVDLLNTELPQPERQWSPRDIVRAHRVGARRQNTTRPMIVKFLHHDDKFVVLGARDRLKQRQIGVGNDLTAFQREQVRRAREDGRKGYFKGGVFRYDETPSPHHHSASSRQPARSSSRQPASSPQSASSSRQSSPSCPRKSSASPSASSSSPRPSYADTAKSVPQQAEEQPGSSETSRPTTRSQSQSRGAQMDDASSTPASQSA